MGKINTFLAPALVIVLAVSLVSACSKNYPYRSQPKGVYHMVKKNETPQMIARAYNVPFQDLIKANKIKDGDTFREGSVIFVPSANKVIDITADTETKKKAVVPKPPAIVAEPKKPIPPKPVPVQKQRPGRNNFIWPVQGTVKSQFGAQPNKTFHNWIKIVSSPDTKVAAAESGTVIFSSYLKNYGETIIIRHQEQYATVYTHLAKRYAKMDQEIKKGDTIALTGERDDAGNVYIHFEIRHQGKAQNPLLFLP